MLNIQGRHKHKAEQVHPCADLQVVFAPEGLCSVARGFRSDTISIFGECVITHGFPRKRESGRLIFKGLIEPVRSVRSFPRYHVIA